MHVALYCPDAPSTCLTAPWHTCCHPPACLALQHLSTTRGRRYGPGSEKQFSNLVVRQWASRACASSACQPVRHPSLGSVHLKLRSNEERAILAISSFRWRPYTLCFELLFCLIDSGVCHSARNFLTNRTPAGTFLRHSVVSISNRSFQGALSFVLSHCARKYRSGQRKKMCPARISHPHIWQMLELLSQYFLVQPGTPCRR